MSVFQDFIQLELPKRPYLNVDVQQETILVRRGPGPRQLSSVVLTEGQVLAFQGGVLVGKNIGTSGSFVRHAIIDVPNATPSAVWTTVHNLQSFNLVWSVYQNIGTDLIPAYTTIIPESVTMVNNNEVTITFNSPIGGKAVISFVD